MGRADDVVRVDEKTFRIDDVAFVSDWSGGVSQPDRFAIMKDVDLIEQYIAVLDSHASQNVIELGVREGGSTALLALVGEVKKLVAFELTPTPSPALVEFIRQRGLADRIRPYFGIDQSDRERLLSVVDEEFGDARLDLVVDDASHRFEPTLASFESLFPRLAPGGLFVIEDWALQHRVIAALAEPEQDALDSFTSKISKAMEDPTAEQAALFATWLKIELEHGGEAELARRVEPPAHAPERPLVDLLTQLVSLVSLGRDVIAELRIDPEWITITRGPAELDPANFRLSELVSEFDRIPARR